MTERRALPLATIRQIQTTCSSDVLLKLQTADKSLVEKYPIYVVRAIRNEKWQYRITDVSKIERMDLSNMKGKIWLTNKIILKPFIDENGQAKDVAATVMKDLCKRLHYNTMNFVRIYSNDALSFEDFDMLAPRSEYVDLYACLKWDNGQPATLEDVLGSLTGIRRLKFWCKPHYGQLAQVLLGLDNMANLDDLFIGDIPATTDLILLQLFIFSFMGDSQVYYFKDVLDPDYRRKLDDLVDGILAIEDFRCSFMMDKTKKRKKK